MSISSGASASIVLEKHSEKKCVQHGFHNRCGAFCEKVEEGPGECIPEKSLVSRYSSQIKTDVECQLILSSNRITSGAMVSDLESQGYMGTATMLDLHLVADDVDGGVVCLGYLPTVHMAHGTRRVESAI